MPCARSFDRSCGTTRPRYPRAPFYLFESATSAPLSGPSFPLGPMGAKRTAPLALVLFLLLFWGILPAVVGQGPEGHLVVATDYELFGTSDLRGGGHVTWTLTGAKAADFRAKILDLFDGYPSIPRGFRFNGTATNGNRAGRLDATEGVEYTNLLEQWLPARGRGTAAQYLAMYPFDLREKSTDG